MRKMFYFVFFIFVFICLSIHVSASSIVVINGYDVRFRSDATTSSKIITSFNPGVELTYIESVKAGNGCSKVWYKANYNNQVGYICSNYAILKEEEIINPDDYKEYSDYLVKLGFPDTYINHLVALHAKHPNWQFKVMNVDVKFDDFVALEYTPSGLSLIEDTGSYIDGYKSLDSWSYNYLTNVFSTDFRGGGDVWYAASKKTIAYYVDPRNFLTEKNIFMFETLSYNKNFHTKEGIQAMLKGTFMENGYADETEKKTFADAFLDAAEKYNISPYMIISRVIQEVGAKGSTIVSGTVTGYEGYYNFYNIKASGNGSEDTIANGLKHAVSQGWDTKYKAIVGGASFLAKDYINAGQDTSYLQKWDVFGPNYGAHQYMQNIEAPYSESFKTYKAYNDISMIESAFVFTIPVYKNMPDKTVLPNKGNPNNYLYDLSLNGEYFFKEPTTKTSFDINLDINTTSVEIAASKVYSGSVVTGTGTVALKGVKETIPVTVTAQNGDVRVYNINITRTGDEAIAISEILRLANIKNDGSYMFGFTLGTDISAIKKLILDRESKSEVSATSLNGVSKTSGIIASGDKIKIKTSREEKEYTIVIYGDVNSDGKISSADYIAIKNHIMDVKILSSLEQSYADANKDGKVSSADYIAIKNHIMDVVKIVQ